ncbi:glycosyltransferase family 39 protein [Microbispora sp. NPDC046933]|uniref:glycosyltransferase family 39 protein n=1 Tax=Microbispora sp. NPDC046933 TaxID=3155618 RepID=UPI0033C664F0
MTRASRHVAGRPPRGAAATPSQHIAFEAPGACPAEAPERAARLDRPGVVTVVPAVLALAAGLWDLGGPPPWRDEAATVSAVGRTLPQLAHLLQSVDAVHGLYYALMHVVAGLSGTAEVALRMPSVVAGALAAAGTGALGRALGVPRAGLYGGVLLALMPIFSRYVQEARPYPMTAAAAVGVTLLFLRLLRSPTSGVLAAYGAALTVLAYFNLFAFLVVGAHGVALILSRGPLLRWACAATPALAAVAPLAWLGSRQSAQVGWIPRPEADDVGRLAVQLSGDLGGATGPGVAPLTWALVLFGLAYAAVAGVRRARAARGAEKPAGSPTGKPAESPAESLTGKPAGRPAGSPAGMFWAAGPAGKAPAGEAGPAPFGHAALVRLTLPWLLVPALVLLTVSWAVHPVYVFRYVFCCVPAAALLAGAGLAALPPGLAAAVLAAWLGLSVPGQLATRGPNGRQDDPRPVMALLAAEAKPGDGVLFVPAKVRKYEAVYPSVFGRLRDVALARSPERDGSFPGREVGSRVLAARLDGLRTLWVVGHTGKNAMPAGRRALVARSFAPAGRWTFRGLFVDRYDVRAHRSNGAGVGK